MVRLNTLFCALILLPCYTGIYSDSLAQSADPFEAGLSDRRVVYTIDASLDPSSKTITGVQRLVWKNPDNVSVDELQFHLYLNAFKDTTSTFMIESGGAHRGYSSSVADPWGGVEIERMVIVESGQEVDVTDRITFIQSTDRNVYDQTVIAVPLPDAVGPGERIILDIEFVSKLPEVIARTGWKQKANNSLFFMVAQWFPKLGVYEVPGQRYVPEDAASGRWSTHQFHANSEFYADFGVYEVDITVPENYVVGASGYLVDERRSDGLVTFSYKAEDVHDFAWTASSDFLEFKDQWENVELRLLIQPEHKGQVKRHFEAAKTALSYFDEWVGPYPYATLTLVDGVGGSNGMEYPTLFTCGTVYMMPGWLRMLEQVTIHEFAHQYFYGIIASNEAEEAWLDEGISSYLEMKIMDEAYGEGALVAWPWLHISNSDVKRIGYSYGRPEEVTVFKESWRYKSNSVYVRASYAKAATVLHTLENYLGWDKMQLILKEYYRAWQFKHPTTRDFIDTVEQVAGEDLGWFFDQFIYGRQVVDYGVGGIDVQRDGDTIKSSFSVVRLGDGVFPITVRAVLDDGTHEDFEWSGEEHEKLFSFTRKVAVEEIYIDPLNDVRLEVNRLNNRKRVTPESSFSYHQLSNAVIWLQHAFQLASNLF